MPLESDIGIGVPESLEGTQRQPDTIAGGEREEVGLEARLPIIAVHRAAMLAREIRERRRVARGGELVDLRAAPPAGRLVSTP